MFSKKLHFGFLWQGNTVCVYVWRSPDPLKYSYAEDVSQRTSNAKLTHSPEVMTSLRWWTQQIWVYNKREIISRFFKSLIYFNSELAGTVQKAHTTRHMYVKQLKSVLNRWNLLYD